MPTEFFVEMCMDRIAASRTYLGDRYHSGAPLEYLLKAGDNRWMPNILPRIWNSAFSRRSQTWRATITP